MCYLAGLGSSVEFFSTPVAFGFNFGQFFDIFGKKIQFRFFPFFQNEVAKKKGTKTKEGKESLFLLNTFFN